MQHLCDVSVDPLQAFSTNRTSVAAIDFFVSDDVGTRMYNSCADVKFAAMNTRAMDFIGGGATDYHGKLPLAL